MKKALLLIILIAITAALFVGCGANKKGLHFEINEDGTEYTVTFIGRKTGSDVVIPDTYNDLPVTKIADNAFRGCRKLKSITIPDSITHVGKKAFLGCSRLENVHINDIAAWCNITFRYNLLSFESNPFSYAENLYIKGELVTDLVIPDSVELINDAVFYNCQGLKSVTISGGEIKDHAFSYCENLEKLTIGKNVTTLHPSVFENCTALKEIYFNATSMNDIKGVLDGETVTLDNYIFANAGKDSGGIKLIVGKDATGIPSRLFSSTDDNYLSSVEFEEGSACHTIGDYAFENCAYLKKVTLPDSVNTICEYAFKDCTALSELDLGNGLTSLGLCVFLNCESLTDIIIPNSMTALNSHAFENCTGLTSFTIPSSVVTFLADVFEGCSSLTEIIVDENNPKFKSIDGNMYSKNGETLYKFAPGKKDTELVIPDHVTTITNYAFSTCQNLTRVTIPDSVVWIGDYAFNGCSNLESATIGNSVTKIDTFAFAGCKNLTDINIPDSVTKIGNSAFSGCRKLKKIIIPDSVTDMGTNVFLSCEKLTIRCEADAKPDSWNPKWNPDKRRVVWGYT